MQHMILTSTPVNCDTRFTKHQCLKCYNPDVLNRRTKQFYAAGVEWEESKNGADEQLF